MMFCCKKSHLIEILFCYPFYNNCPKECNQCTENVIISMAVMHDTLLKCVCTVPSVYHHNVYLLSESFQGTVRLQEQKTKEQEI